MGFMKMHYHSQRILNLSTGAVVASRSSQLMRYVSHCLFPSKSPDRRTLYTLIVDLVGVVL